MTIVEQAQRRIELARLMGAEPKHWLATADVQMTLIAEAADGAWSDDGALLYGIPVHHGTPRSEWGLDLVSAPGR